MEYPVKNISKMYMGSHAKTAFIHMRKLLLSCIRSLSVTFGSAGAKVCHELDFPHMFIAPLSCDAYDVDLSLYSDINVWHFND